jgi:hypothetical protein
MNRRGFLGSLLGLVAAPVVAKLELAVEVFAPAPEALVEVAPGVLMSAVDFRALAKAQLGKWMAERFDQLMFMHLTGRADDGSPNQQLTLIGE